MRVTRAAREACAAGSVLGKGRKIVAEAYHSKTGCDGGFVLFELRSWRVPDRTEPQVEDFSGSTVVVVAFGAALRASFGGLNGRESGHRAWFLRVWLL